MSTFEEFLETVGENDRGFISETHKFLLENGCECMVKSAKMGIYVTYVRQKRTLLNLVRRKSGIQARVYAAHAGEYEDFLDTLPEKVKNKTKKAPDCRKLVGTGNDPRCSGGYEFSMDGEVYKKCRNKAFLIPLSEENNVFIRKFLEKELES